MTKTKTMTWTSDDDSHREMFHPRNYSVSLSSRLFFPSKTRHFHSKVRKDGEDDDEQGKEENGDDDQTIKIMEMMMVMFVLVDCKFKIRKNKNATGRAFM